MSIKQFLPSAFLLTLAVICSAAAEDKPKANVAPAASGTSASGDKGSASKPAANSLDLDAVRQTIETLIKVYEDADAKAFSSHFTADGEYIDVKGVTYHGQKAIEAEFAAFFKARPDTSIDVKLVATRNIAPGVVASDGTTHFRATAESAEMVGRCKLIFVKEGKKWSIASLRETEAVDEHSSHHDRIAQLGWMVGEWIDEGPQSHVHFSCRWDESGNFLIRDFSVQVAGRKAWTGTQRIGYDPVTGHLKAWVFDSDGGYSDGYFHREGESWVLQSSGVTAGGHLAAGTTTFTPIDDHRIAWDAADRVVGGERIADTGKMTIVRKPPAPNVKQSNRNKSAAP